MDTRTEVRNGITFTIKHVDDDYYDRDDYGYFTYRNLPGAILVPTSLTRYMPDDCRYFIPANSFRDYLNGWEKHWINERWARIEAAKYIMQDMRRALDYGRTWWMISVQVTATYQGIEVGQDALFGIESDQPEYVAEVEEDMIQQIIDDLPRLLDRHIADYQARIDILSQLKGA